MAMGKQVTKRASSVVPWVERTASRMVRSRHFAGTLPKCYRSQSAMEYLMTYGWAILIIAVVLGALFSLGVFNGANFAPKAPPGACQVFRPNGPGSTSFINLEGVCNGELPQYIATFARRGNIQVTGIPGLPLGAAPRTITAWFATNSTGGGEKYSSTASSTVLMVGSTLT